MRTHKLAQSLATIVTLMTACGFPIPRGEQKDNRFHTYYENSFGIYYISVSHPLNLINHGTWGYVEGADKGSFEVLDFHFAKDKKHVWYQNKPMPSADVGSFHIDKSGLPKDSFRVFCYCMKTWNYAPLITSDIDVESAEYFIPGTSETYDDTWIRDKNAIFCLGVKTTADRNTFRKIAKTDWLADKNFIYIKQYDDNKWKCETIDSLRENIDSLWANTYYLKNGNNIIFHNKIVDTEPNGIYRYHEVNLFTCVVNEKLLHNGEQVLKDSIDTSTLRHYYYGHVLTDGHSAYYGLQPIDVDAATLEQCGSNEFRDKAKHYVIEGNKFVEKTP